MKLSPVFEECKEEIEDARNNMIKVELLEKNAENYIYEYFEDIKRQVDIRREDLKFKIDNYSDELIKSVETNQMNLIKLSKEVNQIKTNIEKSKDELYKLITQFDTLEFNDKKFEVIKTNVAVVNQEFHKILAEYQDSLIGKKKFGKKKFTFELKESQIEDIFGRVTDVQLNFYSFYVFNKKSLSLFFLKNSFVVILIQLFSINKTSSPLTNFANFLRLNSGNCNTGPQETVSKHATFIGNVMALLIL